MSLNEYLLGEEGGRCHMVGSGVLLFYRWDIVGETEREIKADFLTIVKKIYSKEFLLIF